METYPGCYSVHVGKGRLGLVSPTPFGNGSSDYLLSANHPLDEQRRHASILLVRVVPQPTNRSGRISLLYQNLLWQVTSLAFMDCFRVLCWFLLAAIPLMFFVKKTLPGKAAPDGAHRTELRLLIANGLYTEIQALLSCRSLPLFANDKPTCTKTCS
jgi:hypothetical protein